MKTIRALFALLILAVAFDGAAQTTTSATISIPKAIVWVNPLGVAVAPYVGGGTSYYFDATGAWWVLADPWGTPAAVGLYDDGGGTAIWYTTTNCTGAAYVVVDSDPYRVLGYTDGVRRIRGTATAANVTTGSRWISGACQAFTSTLPLAAASACITVAQPTLPAGPYHLEYR